MINHLSFRGIHCDHPRIHRLAVILRRFLRSRFNHDCHRHAVVEKSGAHKVSPKEALAWSIVWVAVSCAFGGWLYWEIGHNQAMGHQLASQKVMEYFTGYVLEKSLAVDNLLCS